jgi:hypothetical protein
MFSYRVLLRQELVCLVIWIERIVNVVDCRRRH